MASKQLRCSVVGSNNEHSSHHLLQTSEPLKTQWVSFVFEGNASSDLPKCIIRDPASPTEEVSLRFLYESLQITFPNNVLVSKFRG